MLFWTWTLPSMYSPTTPGLCLETGEMTQASWLCHLDCVILTVSSWLCHLDCVLFIRKVTEDGYESQMSTNYLGHFLLTHLLMPALAKTAADPMAGGARVVNVSSCAHYFGELQVTSQSECSFRDKNIDWHWHGGHLNTLITVSLTCHIIKTNTVGKL